MWALEVVYAIGRLFLQPALYIFFISSVLVGYLRVKRERKDFSFKVHDMWYEMRTSLIPGLVFGFLLSVVVVGLGLVLSQASLTIIAVWTSLFALLAQYRYLSPAYSVSMAIFAVVSAPFWLSKENGWLLDVGTTNITALAVLLGFLLLAEGLLISGRGAHATTPRVRKGKRGLQIGVHMCKRLWLLPIFVLVPGDGITKLFAWWPVLTIESQTFSLFLVPFIIGFAKSVKGQVPGQAIFYTGRRVVGLGLFVLVLAGISYWLPGIAIAAAGIALLGRFTIMIREQLEDEKLKPFFSPKGMGLMVLDTLPDSPAKEMGLRPGEVITKINGVVPETLRDFYQALRRHASGASCKLEVVDVNGELRILQRAIYANDHHELGIIFVQRDYDWDTEAV